MTSSPPSGARLDPPTTQLPALDITGVVNAVLPAVAVPQTDTPQTDTPQTERPQTERPQTAPSAVAASPTGAPRKRMPPAQAPPAAGTVPPGPGRPGPRTRSGQVASGPSPGLRAALIVTGMAVAAAAAAAAVLGLRPATTTPTAAPQVAAPGPPGPPAGLTVTSPNSAHYSVGAGPYTIDVQAIRPCWVQVTDGAGTAFAGTLGAGQNRRLVLRGPGRVELGSSGGRVDVAAHGRQATLVPPAAPYAYSFS